MMFAKLKWSRVIRVLGVASLAIVIAGFDCDQPASTSRWDLLCTEPGATLPDFLGVWVEDINTAYIVGDQSTVMVTQYHESLCSLQPVENFGIAETRLNAVFGIDDQYWVVGGQFGANGVILWFDDDTWAVEEEGALIGYNAVWGSSPCDMFAVGEGAMSFGPNGKHWDCVDWAPMEIDFGMSRVSGVAGTSSHDVWVVLEQPTANLWHYDGTTWENRTEEWMNNVLYDISARPNGELWVVGAAGTVYRFDGTAWEDISVSEMTGDFYGIWAGEVTNDVFAVGEAATIYHYSNGEWHLSSVTVGATQDLRAVHGVRLPGEGRYVRYAVGDNGVVLLQASL